jgi:hypothetical protein
MVPRACRLQQVHDLGGVQVQPPGEGQGLRGGFGEIGEPVVEDELGPGAVAGRAQPGGGTPERAEDRGQHVPNVRRAAGQDDQLAGLGRALAAGDRSIDEHDLARVGDAGEPGRPFGSDGGHLHPYRPRTRGQQSVRPGGGLLGGGPVGQHGDDDRGAPDGLRRAARHDRAVRGEGLGAADGAVPHAYAEAAAGQVGGHRSAHAPGAEERDGWCGGRDGGHVVSLLSGRTAVSLVPGGVSRRHPAG